MLFDERQAKQRAARSQGTTSLATSATEQATLNDTRTHTHDETEQDCQETSESTIHILCIPHTERAALPRTIRPAHATIGPSNNINRN